jgi:hypothetical protein
MAAFGPTMRDLSAVPRMTVTSTVDRKTSITKAIGCST